MSFWKRLNRLVPVNSYQAERRLFEAYNRFQTGKANQEDAELIISDLAVHTGFYQVVPPGQDIAYQEGMRAAFGRVFYFLNFTEAKARALAEAALEEAEAEQEG